MSRLPTCLIAAALFWSALTGFAESSKKAPKEISKPPIIRIGLIGLDTSHVTAFTSRFNDPKSKNHVPGAKVVAAFKGGSPDIASSRDRVDGFTKTLQEKYGVTIYPTIREVCDNVDAIMITSVDGRPHLEQALEVFKSRKPVFIDKPIAGSLKDAIAIKQAAKKNRVRCFSSSSLRWYPGVVEVAEAEVGEVKAVYSYGPASLEPSHPDLFWYGVHPTEALFTVIGRGCKTVSRTTTPDTDVVVGVWDDGKVGVLHGIRNAKTGYKLTKFGTKKIVEQKKGGDYTPMLRLAVEFFRGGKPPVSLDETIEIFAFMEAADESKRRGGAPVSIKEVIRSNGG